MVMPTISNMSYSRYKDTACLHILNLDNRMEMGP